VGATILFAIETAMRTGEICNATWENLNLKQRLLHIPTSKNGYPREVPLSSKAIEIINHLVQVKSVDDHHIFQLQSHIA
jgi:putative integrase/recombinase HI_1572